MPNEIVPFDFHGREVRTISLDSEPWFVASDVCDFFGVTNRNRVMQEIDPADKGGTQIDTPGGRQTVTTINEPGLFQLLFALQPQKARGVDQSDIDARMDQVRQFKRWVTHDVLPAIRKTGTFTAPAAPRTEMEIIREQHGAISTLLEHNERMAVQVASLTPSAEAWDEIAAAKGDYSVGDAAKMLARAGVETGPTRLFDQLRGIGWIFRGGDNSWRVYSNQVDSGHLAEKPSFHYHPKTGEIVIDPPQVRVTVKGLARIQKRLSTTTVTAPTLTLVSA